MPAACIQLHNYDLFEKAQLKLSSLIQNRVQQDYLPDSYARHLPSYQKCHKIVAPTRCVDCSPFPWTFMVNSGNGEKSYPTAKNLFISPNIKILLDLNLSPKKISIPSTFPFPPSNAISKTLLLLLLVFLFLTLPFLFQTL